jgi:hypothetical protein
MNDRESKVARKIWPQHMRHQHAKIEARRKHAREWMIAKFGESHLLAPPARPNRG